MDIRFDYTNLVANKNLGLDITEESLFSCSGIIDFAHNQISLGREKNILGFYDLVDHDTAKILNFTNSIKDRFDYFVVLGIGGSALGNRALYSALKNSRQLKKKVITLDNVDPEMLFEMLNSIELDRTLFNVITKSGTTTETMSTFLIVLEILKKQFPGNYKDHIVITTDNEKGLLRKIVEEEGYRSFVVPGNVGGRFSVFSDVGLLSSAFAGIDITQLLKGAADMKRKCTTPDISQNPAYLNGLLHYLHLKKGRSISVMMPYANDLYDLADWYRQIWAESLGKKYNLKSEPLYLGQTPVKALGTTDQHSQVQLYTEGPDDKIFTFLSVKKFAHDYTIPGSYPSLDDLNYLGGKSLSHLLNVERLATEVALTYAGRPNCNIIFPGINEFCIGQFIFMYEVQTVFTGYLMNIDPLDQPGVEAGKIATYAMMGKKGFEKQAQELENYINHKEKNGKLI